MASDVLRFIKILLLLISFVGAIVAFYLLYLNSHQYFMGTTDVPGIIIPTLAILVTLLVLSTIFTYKTNTWLDYVRLAFTVLVIVLFYNPNPSWFGLFQ